MQEATSRSAERAIQARALGQSLWYDNISRQLLESGELRRLIDDGIITGITTNPSIFQKAVDSSDAYASRIQSLKSSDPLGVYHALTADDVSDAADLLRPVFDRTEGRDGHVSLELPPDMAHDVERSVAEGQRLVEQLDKPNVMIKVPGTPAGVEAFRQLTELGLNINVTLLFSLRQYDAIARAYVQALEARRAKNLAVDKIASVASFFVSRVDSVVDQQLADLAEKDPSQKERLLALQGKAGIANCKVVYAHFREIFGADFEKSRAAGAAPQRVLWASTSTKNPAYPDVLYVDTLLGEDTVNTLPPATLDAFLDHGTAQEKTVEQDEDGARGVLSDLADVGIDLDAVCEKLQEDGVDAFAKAFDALVGSLERQLRSSLSTPA